MILQPNLERPNPVVCKVAWRLIPFLGLLYLRAFLDRVNVGFAALTMNAELGFSATVFGTGAGIFFLGYVAWGVPSNLMLHRFGARRWIAFTMVAWGVVSAAMAFTRTPGSSYILRFLLGVAEAGFFPGVILYLTYWFAEPERARTLGAFMVSLPLASVIGAPISSVILEVNGFGLHGWQRLFLMEGLPAVAVGTLVLKLLADGPERAGWLTTEERSVLVRWIREHRAESEGASAALGLRQRGVWILCVAYFALLSSFYSYSIWLPQIIQGLGQFSYRKIGLLTMVPHFACGAHHPWARHSDATGDRRWHVVIPLIRAALGLGLAASARQPSAYLVALTLSAAGIYSSLPIFWSLCC